MTTARFTLRLDPDLKLWLEKEALLHDRSAGWIANRALEQMKHASDARQQIIGDAVKQADNGVFVSKDAVHAWMQTWDTPNEASVPKPDIFQHSK